MLLDLHNAAEGLRVDADVCVVGAGAAGISLTRRLRLAGHRVCLLESGGLDFEAETQSLYEGLNEGMPYYDLVDARLRFFGGTTNIWGGRCTPRLAIAPMHPGPLSVRVLGGGGGCPEEAPLSSPNAGSRWQCPACDR